MGQQLPGCLGWLFGFGKVNETNSESAEEIAAPVRTDVYRLRDDFLSSAEASFFRVLRLAVGQEYAIFPKVRLGDLFYVTRPHENRGAINRIGQRHVDFVLCDPESLKPLLGLELDDTSHRDPKNSDRDLFKDAVFRAAGLPLLRIPARHSYAPAELRSLLESKLGENGVTARLFAAPEPGPMAAATELNPPTCPKCAIPMTLRTASRGDKAGETFWGCTNYPRCRQKVG